MRLPLSPCHAPGSHWLHLPDASGELVPAGHGWHVSLTVLSRNVPAGQGLQKLLPRAPTS